MAVEIVLTDEDSAIDEIDLSDVEMPLAGQMVEGLPRRFVGKNVGDSTVKDFAIELTGEGADKVRLAVDQDGDAGTWAAPGESIYIGEYLGPRESFAFWTQALFTDGDRVGEYSFQVVFRGSPVG
mgnify:CR=1 FL=1